MFQSLELMFDSLELVFDSLELVFQSLELMFQSLEHRFIYNWQNKFIIEVEQIGKLGKWVHNELKTI